MCVCLLLCVDTHTHTHTHTHTLPWCFYYSITLSSPAADIHDRKQLLLRPSHPESQPEPQRTEPEKIPSQFLHLHSEAAARSTKSINSSLTDYIRTLYYVRVAGLLISSMIQLLALVRMQSDVIYDEHGGFHRFQGRYRNTMFISCVLNH